MLCVKLLEVVTTRVKVTLIRRRVGDSKSPLKWISTRHHRWRRSNNGEPTGVDLFDSPQAFRPLMPKILRGYALDAIDRRSNPLPDVSSSAAHPGTKTVADTFVRQVLDAPRTQFAAPGLGQTWRLFAPQVAGGALMANGNLVHLSAFRA